MRIRIFAGFIAFFLTALVCSLFYLQVAEHASYKSLSEQNRIRIIPLAAPRGKLYDRSGRLLVTNRVAFDVEIIYQEIKDKEKIINTLSRILDIEKALLAEKIKEAKKRPFGPVAVKEDVEKDNAIRVEEVMLDLPGVIVTTRPLRKYNYGSALAHLTGYLGKINERELRKYKMYGYQVKDFVGKDGIERTYNDYLRGVRGGFQVEVDAKGRQARVLALKKPCPGKDLYLTIDIELQKFCDSLLGEKNGVILAMDPKTGAIFALVSHASFDPNVFISSKNFQEVSRLLNDSEFFPLVNRAISGTYPSGSIFKIVVASAALDSGAADEGKTFFCKGSFRLGDRSFGCWNEEGHGAQTIAQAVKNSCNVFFYQLGLFAGPDEMAKYAFKFGFGNATGVDLPGEAKGFVPTPAWKRRKLKEPWYKGGTANYAIGQGYFLATPIQVARLVAAIANGGELVSPFSVRKIEEVELRRAENRKIGLKDTVPEFVKAAMRDVVNAPGGTGVYARSKEVVISGKTGTAENPGGKSHAWFAGFAPFEDPKFSIVVFIEHGGKGGLEPAIFAKKIIEEAKKLRLL